MSKCLSTRASPPGLTRPMVCWVVPGMFLGWQRRAPGSSLAALDRALTRTPRAQARARVDRPSWPWSTAISSRARIGTSMSIPDDIARILHDAELRPPGRVFGTAGPRAFDPRSRPRAGMAGTLGTFRRTCIVRTPGRLHGASAAPPSSAPPAPASSTAALVGPAPRAAGSHGRDGRMHCYWWYQGLSPLAPRPQRSGSEFSGLPHDSPASTM